MDCNFTTIKTCELKDSTFRSRILDFGDFDISDYTFSAVYKAGFDQIISELEITAVGNILTVPLEAIEGISNRAKAEVWMLRDGGFKDKVIVFDVVISATGCPSDASITEGVSVTFGGMKVPVVITQAVYMNITDEQLAVIAQPAIEAAALATTAAQNADTAAGFATVATQEAVNATGQAIAATAQAENAAENADEAAVEALAAKDAANQAAENALSGIKDEATPATVPSPTGFERWIVHTAGTYTNFLSGGSPITVTAADLDVVAGVARNEVVLEVNNGVSTKRVRRLKGDKGDAADPAKLPLYSAIKSANIVAGTQFIDDENGNIQYRVKIGQTLLTTDLPANVVGTKVEVISARADTIELYEDLGITPPFNEVSLHNVMKNNIITAIWSGVNYISQGVSGDVFTFTATAATGRANGRFTSVAGNKYYVKIDVKSDSNLTVVSVPGASFAPNNHSGSGNFEKISGIVTATVTADSLSFNIIDNRTSGWTPIQIKKALAVDLTATYGAGNEPTKEVFEAILADYPDYWFNTSVTYLDKSSTNGKFPINRGGNIVWETYEGKPLLDKIIVWFGDSITEFGDSPQRLAARTGATVIDASVGGTRLTHNGSIPNYDDLSFVRLVTAIVTNNWTAQDAAIANLITERGDDNTANYNALKAVNWANVHAVVFMYGTNDYRSMGTVIGNPTDTTTTRNVYGALNHVFTNFCTNFKHIKLYPITPIFYLGDTPGADSDSSPGPNTGMYLWQLADAIIAKAKEYHFPVLDLHRECGFNKFNGTHYIADGTHPTAKGYEVIGDKIAKHLISK